MAELQTHPTIALKRAEPQLFTIDLARSLAFFTEKLGFETRFTYGEPPFYAQVARGDAHLNLRSVPKVPTAPGDDLLSATICVEAIGELFNEFRASGAAFHQELRTEPWGALTFIVRDPDGNLILFAE
ncbi:MAG: VOC family protein [Fimbriimonadales bacterium]